MIMNDLIECSEEQTTIPKEIIESLDFNQGGVGRHKCVICAYYNGIEDGKKLILEDNNSVKIEKCKHGRVAPKNIIEKLHTNQKPNEGRHKCAICAYHFGYEMGAGDSVNYYDEFENTEDEESLNIYDISSYGISIDVDTLVKRVNKGKYFIPDFQRDYVWDDKQASRLIESIIMGLPIPSIFIAKDDNYEGEKYFIIDGQQRLTTIKRFYNNKFKLKGIIGDLNNKDYTNLEEKYRERLGDYAFHVIVIRQEKPDDNNDSIFKIFERINTEGTKLSPQEIRTATYFGDFSKFLTKLTEFESWKNFIKIKSKRKKHEELILRFFALYYKLEEYHEPMKSFLNIFMKQNRNMKIFTKQDMQEKFEKVLNILSKLDKSLICLKGSNRINTQLLDSIMYAIAKTDINNIDKIKEKIEKLKDDIDNNFEYSKYWESRRSDKELVIGRCEYVENLFKE